MASVGYHEPVELLSADCKDLHRAIVSLMEELEAIDWYQQRAEACTDDELRRTLIHNKNEEVEHASMTLEWIRRRSPEFDANLRRYLFTTGPITETEAAHMGGGDATAGETPERGHATTSLGLGSLKGRI
jgi:ferritin-like protein